MNIELVDRGKEGGERRERGWKEREDRVRKSKSTNNEKESEKERQTEGETYTQHVAIVVGTCSTWL